MSTLTIYTTKSCNLDCSFCGNKVNMADDSRMIKDLDDVLEQHLIENPNTYSIFSISGGEPLLDLDKLSRVLGVLLGYQPNTPILINTNATKLTQGFVNQINKFPNVKLILSIDGLTSKPRGLFDFIENKSTSGYLNLILIETIKNKEINFVITREMLNNFNLVFEIYTLVKLFDCQINLALNQTKESLRNFTIDDIYKFQKLLMRLEALNVLNSKVNVKYMFNSNCNGKNIKALNWDGNFYYECEHNGFGCSYMRNNMKVGFYDLLHKIVNLDNFQFDSKLEDKPTYSTEIGFVGERFILQPLRKNNAHHKNTALNIAIKNVN